MAHSILMPKAGQSMTEGTIVTWFKKEGESVERGEPLLEIETDKANLDVEAPEAGVLRKVFHDEGEVVPVLAVLAVLGSADEKIDFEALRAENADAVQQKPTAPTGKPPSRKTAPAKSSASRARPGPGTAGSLPTRTAGPARTGVTAPSPGTVAAASVVPLSPGEMAPLQPVSRPATGKRVAASPVARRLANERGVDLAALSGSGPNGRILRRDVESAPISSPNSPAILPAPGPTTPYPPPTPRPPETVALDGMRGAIARTLTQSKTTIPHFYMTMAIDVTTALGVKQALAQSGTRVTVNDLVLRACALALQDEPGANCRVFDDHIEYPSDLNLGVAVGSDDGLVVPVILSAQNHDLQQLAVASREIIQNAQQGKLVGTGQGTFTISNLGMWGVESFTAIINPPEGAILAVGGIRQELVAAAGGLFPRSILRVSLSCDHRAIDGLIAARFLARLKYLLESGQIA